MAKLAEDIASLKAKLDDPALFARSPQEFERTAAALARAEADLAATEEEWLALELKREDLERQD
jgi:ATP-binding cassette subfamily F protein uup